MREAVIVSVARSPIGRANQGSWNALCNKDAGNLRQAAWEAAAVGDDANGRAS
jgi:acetyl-CoA acetyltransferase